MATSYTSLLGLALPVTGELGGTWGDTVNNSITSLLDTAIAGTTTLSTDADVTLSTTTGASNQARQAILLCSGARTALRTITAPAQSKIYAVVNSTTGGFGVKIVGAGPTTGVTVAAGKTAIVIWNGSDFVEVAPATATTATNLAGGLAGSVPYQTAASTTTMLAIGANNYVLTSNGTAPLWSANTGTGDVVRATSPTLVTPNLGTPSAGVVTNLTGTASININGTVGATTPTTGSFTTLTTSSTVTINNGTANGVVYLNASKVLTAGSALSYSGGALTTTGSFAASDGTNIGEIKINAATLDFNTSSAGVPQVFRLGSSERMRLTSTGLGIGTSSPSSKFVVSNSGAAGLEIAPVLRDAVTVGASLLAYNRSGAAFVPMQFSSSDLRFATSDTERMRLDSGGNLGIGTDIPTATLDVRGTMYVIGAGGTRVTDTSGGNGFEVVASTTNNILSYNRTTTAYLPVRWRAGIQSWEVDNVERMRLNSSGNLGLGVTPSAWGAGFVGLDIGSSMAALAGGGNNMYLTANAYYNGTNWIYKAGAYATQYQQQGGAHQWYTAGVGVGGNAITFTERMRLDVSGNLGIGTASPTQKLDVNGIARFADPGASRDMLIAASTTGTVHRFYSTNTSAGYAFENSTTELMRVTSGGDFGVGVTPSTRLHVYSASSLISRTQSATTGYAVGNYVNSSGNFYVGIDSSTAGGFALGNYSRLLYSDGAYPIVIATNSNERMRIDSAGNVGIGTSSPVNKLQINGSLGRNAPVTKTGNFTLADTENWLICNGTGTITVTFPAASSWTGREVMIKTIAAFTVVSASSNVVPLAGGAAGTAILAATAGAWATLVSDGTNWVIMQA